MNKDLSYLVTSLSRTEEFFKIKNNPDKWIDFTKIIFNSKSIDDLPKEYKNIINKAKKEKRNDKENV